MLEPPLLPAALPGGLPKPVPSPPKPFWKLPDGCSNGPWGCPPVGANTPPPSKSPTCVAAGSTRRLPTPSPPIAAISFELRIALPNPIAPAAAGPTGGAAGAATAERLLKDGAKPREALTDWLVLSSCCLCAKIA